MTMLKLLWLRKARVNFRKAYTKMIQIEKEKLWSILMKISRHSQLNSYPTLALNRNKVAMKKEE